jgi:hypothetical protein
MIGVESNDHCLPLLGRVDLLTEHDGPAVVNHGAVAFA